jgi:hypothetical protein
MGRSCMWMTGGAEHHKDLLCVICVTVLIRSGGQRLTLSAPIVWEKIHNVSDLHENPRGSFLYSMNHRLRLSSKFTKALKYKS